MEFDIVHRIECLCNCIVTKFVSGFMALGLSFSCPQCSRRGDGEGWVLGQVVLLCSGALCGFALLVPLEQNLHGIDVLLIVSHAISFGFRLCLQCHPVGDVVSCGLMGDVVP